MFKDIKNSVDIANGFTIYWTRQNIGFGQISFYEVDGKLKCDSEGMGQEFVKQILCDLVDHSEIED